MISREGVTPSLLDRLTDDDPEKTQETRVERTYSLEAYRNSVLRDLSWLLNSTSLEVRSMVDMSQYKEILSSTLNYGMPDLSGTSLSGLDTETVEKTVRDAIIQFEPRLIPRSLRIKGIRGENKMSGNALSFEIDAELKANPISERVLLRTRLDLETGEMAVEFASER